MTWNVWAPCVRLWGQAFNGPRCSVIDRANTLSLTSWPHKNGPIFNMTIFLIFLHPIHFPQFPSILLEGYGVEGGKTIEKWITKPLSFIQKFQICTKVLVVTHVHYYSYSVSPKVPYSNLEKTLINFLWANIDKSKGFHTIHSKLHYTPWEFSGLGIIKTHLQSQSMCIKWVIWAIHGK